MLGRLPILLAVVWTALAAVAPLSPAPAAEPQFPEGMRIGLVPPNGLTLSSHFPGFEDSARQVTIRIFDLPGGAYKTIERTAFDAEIKGLTVRKRELFSFAHGMGYLFTGHAEIDGSSVYTYGLLTNTIYTGKLGHVAAFVRVHVPDAAHEAYPDAVIRAALQTVAFRVPPAAEVREELAKQLLKEVPFKLGDMAGFRVMRVVPPALAVLIDGPQDDPIKNPYMLISIGRGAPDQGDARARFSRELLADAPLKNIAVTNMESMRIQNQPGYEVRADANGPDGSPVKIVQWLRFGTVGYLRVVGVVPKDRWDELFPRFRAVRDGIDRH
jgi:catechol 2,3-dioxygenase-like lactoylglutathione lyase family enzyme